MPKHPIINRPFIDDDETPELEETVKKALKELYAGWK